jgi:hypothetical protein
MIVRLRCLGDNMDEIKIFLDYSIFLLSADNRIYEKHLLDFKDHIVRPVISYLNENSIEIYTNI